MLGWILTVGADHEASLDVRSHPPCYVHPKWGPVHEVLFWHRRLRKWFCMSYTPPEQQRPGVVYFRPHDRTTLQMQVRRLEQLAGAR